MKRKRVLPPTYLLIAIITMVLLHCLAPILELIAYPLTLFGIVPLAAGIALNLMADSAFKKEQTTVKPFADRWCNALVCRLAQGPSSHSPKLVEMSGNDPSDRIDLRW